MNHVTVTVDDLHSPTLGRFNTVSLVYCQASVPDRTRIFSDRADNCLVVELFNVEYHCDLEMWVRGHSRSFKQVQFENFGTASYLQFTVTMAVSLAICTISSVEEWKTRLEVS